MATLKTASVLAFERKLANSDGIMHACNWDDRNNVTAIPVQEKAVRGTISNRLKNAIASDNAKLDAETQKPNLQRVDTAALPFDKDTLKLSFTLRVLGDLAQPSACNSPEYQAALEETVKGYVEKEQFTELAQRYAENLANARFMWRNRIGAEDIEVQVTSGENTWKFSSLDFNLRFFGSNDNAISALSEEIREGLLGNRFVLLRVEAFVKLGSGQEVYPSQELVLDSGSKSQKSKFLYDLNGVAAMHSQKIGNALRTIDTWHAEAESVGAIAVEPYGSVTSRGKAYRQPKAKDDFYNLLDNWVLKGKVPAVEQQHYVMATLIRGGVFGEAK